MSRRIEACIVDGGGNDFFFKSESCTKDVQRSVPFTVGPRSVELVDTPGFSDTNGDPEKDR